MKRKLGFSFCTAALIAVAATYNVHAQASQTPTEAVAACIENAWAVNSGCQTDASAWNDIPCAIKFEADAILCVGVLIR